MADAGFGIYSVAHHSIDAGHDFLFRSTKARFKPLRRRAELIDEGPTHKTYHLKWTPSVKDRKSNPDLPEDASIEVVVHEVEISSSVTLYLVSSMELDGPTAAELYCRRYDVEFDIRDVKVTVDAENIRAKSVEMFKKETLHIGGGLQPCGPISTPIGEARPGEATSIELQRCLDNDEESSSATICV